MRAAPAEIQSVDGHGVSAVAGDRAHEKNLVERELAVRQRTTGDAEPRLEINGRRASRDGEPARRIRAVRGR